MNPQRVPFILPSGCCLNSQLANKQVMEVLPLHSMKLELSCVKTIKGKSADFIRAPVAIGTEIENTYC